MSATGCPTITDSEASARQFSGFKNAGWVHVAGGEERPHPPAFQLEVRLKRLQASMRIEINPIRMFARSAFNPRHILIHRKMLTAATPDRSPWRTP